MSLLDDAREAVAAAPRGDGCRYCEPWYQEPHRPDCPIGLLMRAMPALEAAEATLKEAYSRNSYDERDALVCFDTLAVLDAALKEPA